ncbi:MAG: PAS domain-containing sensor histidine kinase [Armatimonadetes bacterium]|nr:PAS domain-containing sensor histidine kinase [Armatimonadota bacterium]
MKAKTGSEFAAVQVEEKGGDAGFPSHPRLTWTFDPRSLQFQVTSPEQCIVTEVLGKTFTLFDFIRQLDRESRATLIKTIRSNGNSAVLGFKCHSISHVRLDCFALRVSESSSISGVAVPSVRRSTALQMERPSLELGQVLDHLPAITWIRDADSKLVYCNEAYIRASGRPYREVINRSLEASVPSEYSQLLIEHHRQVMTTGRSITWQQRGQYGNGRMYEHQKFPIVDEQGNVVAVGNLAYDVEEMVRARKLHAGFSDSMEQLAVGAPALEVLNSLINAYREIENDVEVVIAFEYDDSWAWVPIAGEYARTAESVLFGRPSEIPYRQIAIRGRDDRNLGFIFFMSKTPNRLEALDVNEISSLTRAVAVTIENLRDREQLRTYTHDLERLVRMRTMEIEAVNQELEAFAHGIAHDLRSSIRSILANAHFILEEADENEDLKSLAQRQHDVCTKLAQQIEGVMSVAKLSRRPIRPRTVDLSEIALETWNELVAKDDNARLEVQPDLLCQADPDLCRVVLQNLLENALKYRSGRPLVVTVRQVAPNQVEVADNGVGFSPEDAERIMSPFERLHGETVEGVGLGLASVRRIMRRMGGDVRASGQVDVGAAFTLVFAN